ncbi:peptidoglycan editing factor PgeF [Bacillaceae bacterium S4-13-58]
MKEPFQMVSSSLLAIDEWQKIEPTLSVGFTTKIGGESRAPYQSLNLAYHVADDPDRVTENRKRVAEDLGFPLTQWIMGEQIHGKKVVRVGGKDAGLGSIDNQSNIAQVDGLITNEKNLLLVAAFADCAPLYFWDPVSGNIGLAHAGWRGTVQGIGTEMLRQFLEAGSKMKDIKIAIGPCIGQPYYEVDTVVIDQIPAQYHRESMISQVDFAHYLLNLKEVNRQILLDFGACPGNILTTNYCTHEDSSLFYSHRRDQGKTGRMLAYIGKS